MGSSSPSLAATVLVLLIGTLVPIAGAQGNGDEKPEATEVGVTADEIRIVVIVDIDTPVAPGLFKGSADAVEGFAKYINKTGGLAGRKVVVDVIDSKLNADEARNAVIQACAEDFAMVGHRSPLPQQHRRPARMSRPGRSRDWAAGHSVPDHRSAAAVLADHVPGVAADPVV